MPPIELHELKKWRRRSDEVEYWLCVGMEAFLLAWLTHRYNLSFWIFASIVFFVGSSTGFFVIIIQYRRYLNEYKKERNYG